MKELKATWLPMVRYLDGKQGWTMATPGSNLETAYIGDGHVTVGILIGIGI